MLVLLFFARILVQDSVFHYVGEKYGIDPLLLKSIAIVESSLKPALGFNKNGTIDYGVMQINTFWVEKWNLNRAGLLTDQVYCVEVSARILKHLFETYGYNWNAVGYYHSPTYERRREYAIKVARVYSKLRKNYAMR